MAINFPANPNLNDTFTVGNTNYVWDGTKWTASVTGGIALDKIQEGNTSAEVIDTGTDGRFVVTTEGTERLRVTSAGLVGIGTSSPVDILHLSNAGDLYLRVANTSTGINAYLGQDSNGTYIGNTGAAAVRFIQGAAERMRLDTSGRLGIGTSTPAELFDVNGKAIIRNALGVGGTNYGSSGQVLTSQGSGAAPQWATPAGGAWQFISSVTASSSSSVAFTSGIDSTYDVYAIVFNNVVQVGGTNADVYMRLSTNGGSTWISGTSDYNKSRDFDPSSYSQDSGIRIITILKSSTAPATPISGIVYLYNFNISGSVSSVSSLTLNSQNGVNIAFGGSTVASGVHNAVQIYPETTTMSGTFRLYGIKNS